MCHDHTERIGELIIITINHNKEGNTLTFTCYSENS